MLFCLADMAKREVFPLRLQLTSHPETSVFEEVSSHILCRNSLSLTAGEPTDQSWSCGRRRKTKKDSVDFFGPFPFVEKSQDDFSQFPRSRGKSALFATIKVSTLSVSFPLCSYCQMGTFAFNRCL